MKNRVALWIAIVFLIIYSIASTIGSIFLITFGEKTLYKTIMSFFFDYPFNWWDRIILRNYIIGISLNIIFWTFIVYFLSLGTIKFIGYVKSIG